MRLEYLHNFAPTGLKTPVTWTKYGGKWYCEQGILVNNDRIVKELETEYLRRYKGQ